MADSLTPRATCEPLYVLRAADGRFVTNDTRTGPALTSNPALPYVWISSEAAEAQRPAYESALGAPLTVAAGARL